MEVEATRSLDTYTDEDHAGDFESAKITNALLSGSGARNCFTLSYVDWRSKLQTVVALSTPALSMWMRMGSATAESH